MKTTFENIQKLIEKHPVLFTENFRKQAEFVTGFRGGKLTRRVPYYLVDQKFTRRVPYYLVDQIQKLLAAPTTTGESVATMFIRDGIKIDGWTIFHHIGRYDEEHLTSPEDITKAKWFPIRWGIILRLPTPEIMGEDYNEDTQAWDYFTYSKFGGAPILMPYMETCNQETVTILVDTEEKAFLEPGVDPYKYDPELEEELEDEEEE